MRELRLTFDSKSFIAGPLEGAARYGEGELQRLQDDAQRVAGAEPHNNALPPPAAPAAGEAAMNEQNGSTDPR